MKTDLSGGLIQAAIVSALALAVALYARRLGIHLLRDLAAALGRGLSQICAVGLILIVVLKGPWWMSPLVLAGMIGAAAKTSSRRSRRFPRAGRISLYAILAGAGSVIFLMAMAGVIDRSAGALVPVGSMLIANAMNANALAMERFAREVQSHVGEIETALALGAAAESTVGEYSTAALQTSLIPTVDNLRSLGIVWIPGIMAGMVLSGAAPLAAAVYQFVVLAMIFCSSSVTCMVSTRLMRRRAFTEAEQLIRS